MAWQLKPNILVVLTGAVVDSMDKNGCTALHIAALYGHELLSGTLLTFQADPSKSGYEGTVLQLLSCFLTQCCCVTVSFLFSSH
jgi:ankyrin repeat protein